MNNTDIKNWIEEMEMSYRTIFKYVLLDGDTHIIKYEDCLKNNMDFIKNVSNFIVSFRIKTNEDIAIIEESDDFFEIEKYDYCTSSFFNDSFEGGIYLNKIIKNDVIDKGLTSYYHSSDNNYAYAA